MKDFVGALGGAAKEFYEQLPIHDEEKKLQIKKEKIRRLKQQENEIYADIGRQVYRRTSADKFPLHRKRIENIQVERHELEREMEDLLAKCHPELEKRTCARCGNRNAMDLQYCRFCGFALQKNRCINCGEENPTNSVYCGHCGTQQT